MSLPIQWIDRIFEKLTLIYGVEFTSRWKGISLADVKTDWAHELAGFAHWPEAIAYALQNMPSERPPTVLQFRELCRKAPPKALPQLPEPKADPARMAAELAKLGEMRQQTAQSAQRKDCLEWARRIVARHDNGDKDLTLAQISMARSALGI